MQMRELPFTDLLSHIVDNRGRTCPTAPYGRPLIATNCISNDNLYPSYETERYVSDETYRSWFRAHPLPGDIIFVCKGSPGRVALAPDPVDFCIAQDMVAVRADESRIYPKYLFAVLRSRLVQERINNMHVGTLIPHFKKGDFSKLQIPLPDRDTQRSIGDTYFELSDKIEQNRRTGRALEGLARATFKAWFVDFEPVKAKAAGAAGFPGMPPAAFAAIPDHLTESPVGRVPQGWAVQRLAEVMTLQYGKSLTKAKRQPGDVPVYGSGGVDGTHNEALVDGPGIVVGRKGSVGTIYWVDTDFFAIDTTYFVQPTGYLRLPYLYELLKTLGLEAMNTDAAVPGLNRENAYRLEIAVPPSAVAQGFDEFVGPIREFLRHLAAESSKLAALRDYLLPRLLSGRVRVRPAQSEVKG